MIQLAASLDGILQVRHTVLEEVQVLPSPKTLHTEISQLQHKLRQQYDGLAPAQISGLAEARQIYKAAGIDPTRYRPSSEALLRRSLKGQQLYAINNAVDCCNWCSLEFLLPFGLYDLDQLKPPLHCRLGRAGEGYEGIRKGPINLENRLGLFDQAGGFGSPSSDSLRSSVSEATRRLLLVVYAAASHSPDSLEQILAVSRSRYMLYCQAAPEQ